MGEEEETKVVIIRKQNNMIEITPILKTEK